MGRVTDIPTNNLQNRYHTVPHVPPEIDHLRYSGVHETPLPTTIGVY